METQTHFIVDQPEAYAGFTRMSVRFGLLAVTVWCLALGILGILSRHHEPSAGWDDGVFLAAAHSLALGHDPYLDSLADEDNFLAALARGQAPPFGIACVSPPCPYVYAPATLKVLPTLAKVPVPTLRRLFKLCYALGVVAVPLALLLAATRPGRERSLFLLLTPVLLVYLGLTLESVVFSGNVAYILYALVLPAAVLGWKRRLWLPFYLAVLLASTWKAPLLTLIAIPVLSDQVALLGSGVTAIAGAVAFAVQSLIWPERFHHFLKVLDMLFLRDADFGVSPAGLLGRLLFFHHIYYSPWTSIAYLLYAPGIAFLLWKLRWRFLAGEFTLQEWIPVLLTGTLLLNPRVKEYDIAAMTVPLALLCWRLLGRRNTLKRTALEFSLFLFAIAGLADLIGLKCTCCFVISGLLASGIWRLFHPVVPVAEGGDLQQHAEQLVHI